MKEGSSVPTAIAFVCIIGLLVFSVFFIKDNIEKKRKLNELKESAEVGQLPNLNLNIAGKIYTIKCESTKAAKNFVDNLPLEVEFGDLNNIGKSANVYFKLLSESKNIKKGLVGDVLLEGNSTIILVDKSFKTNNRYTKIGHIDDMEVLPGGQLSAKIVVSD